MTITSIRHCTISDTLEGRNENEYSDIIAHPKIVTIRSPSVPSE